MKTQFTLLAVVLAAHAAFAQNDIAKFFPSGKDNTNVLVDAYMSPMAKDLSIAFNNGWYTTAKTHKQFGFDLTVTANNLLVNGDQSYADKPTLSGVEFLNTTSGSTKMNTVYGPKDDLPRFRYTSGANAGQTFQGPDGFEPGKDYPLEAIVVPTIQLGFGVIKKTDIRIRYTPEVKINDIKMDNWGVGIMHDINQHLPVLSELPFSWSLFVGYTQMNGTIDLSGEFAGSGQEGVLKGKGITIQTLVSKNFSVITFYGSIGYQHSSMDYNINGTYNVGSPGGESTVLLPAPFILTNPYAKSYSTSGIRGSAGIQLKFGPMILNSDFTLANSQKLLTAGFGFTIH